jgi:cysteinyl-tRNA synthetase
LGVNLRVYALDPFTSNRVKAEITDVDDKLLFSAILNAKTFDEVAEKLSLTLIKPNETTI